MKKNLLIIFLLSGLSSYCQTTIEIENKMDASQFKYKVSRIINPYSNSQELIEEGVLNIKTAIAYQPQQSLEKVVLEIDKQTYSFYAETNGYYHLVITNLDSLEIALNEENSSINTSLKAVDAQFELLYHLKPYFQGTKEGTIDWLHSGRSKNNARRSIGIINRNIKSIKKEDWCNENNNEHNIRMYLAPYIFVEDFKNDNLAGNLTKSETMFQDIEENITNPIYAESFKFFYGYSLRQNFMPNPHSSMKSANKESYVAFKKAIEVIAEINNNSKRQLALLALYDNYYHSFYFYFGAKKTVIEPGLEVILNKPSHPIIKEYATYLKNELSILTVGEEVPDFKLISYDGDSISFSDLKGKYVYLDFWFSGCAPCIRAMRDLPSTVDKYQNKVHFVSINSFDSFEKGKKIVEDNGFIGIKLHAGKNHQILTDYNIQYYPTYYLISPEGKLLFKPVDYYSKELENVLKYLD